MPEAIKVLRYGSLLIESLPDEDVEQFRLHVVELLTEIYGHLPEWVKFNIGPQYEWRGRFYRTFLCPSGSVDSRIQLYIEKPGGIERGVILRGSRSGNPCCSEIRFGIETEFDCAELRKITDDNN